MTSEPDGKPGRRPPTIELTATEVGNSAATAQSGAERPSQDPAAAQVARGNGGGTGRLRAHAVGSLIGAIAMAALIAGLWLGGFMPGREAAPAAPAASAASAGAGADIAGRLDKIEAAIAQQRREPAPEPANAIAAAEAQIKSLADSLAALNHRADEIAGASQSVAKQADAAQAAAEAAKTATQSAGQTAAQKTDLDALANRVAGLERAVAALTENAARPTSLAGDRAARLTIAAETLRAAVERGAPYQPELAAVRALGVEPAAVAPLEPFAATGVPGAQALARELSALLPAVQRAANATAETTLLARLEANAQHLVRIAPVDAPLGNDPSAVIARLTRDAARADIAAALTDVAALPEAAKPLVADWVNKAQARDAAIAAGRRIAAAALAALAEPAAQ